MTRAAVKDSFGYSGGKNTMPDSNTIPTAVEKYKDHYKERLASAEIKVLENDNNIKQHFSIQSKSLRENNYPMIFYHGQKTRDVMVLTHGLTDSPNYMRAIGERFYQAGLNVVLPLLPAHGLQKPAKALKDKGLDQEWQDEMDLAVEVALMLGDRVSLGGFSTGGALSLNKILREPEKIQGGLFLFSAAVDLGLQDELGHFPGLEELCQAFFIVTEKEFPGEGPNPYKYPNFPKATGVELCQVIRSNEALLKDWEKQARKITNPVFAAHSVNDETLKKAGTLGLIELLENHVENGLAFLIAQTVPHGDQLDPDDGKRPDRVRHEEVVLADKIPLKDASQPAKSKKIKQPLANPKFDLMMQTALQFLKNYLK
jgi:esterase/lipase